MDIIEKNDYTFNRHPWEISRAFCILDLLRVNPAAFCYADIGAGDLYFTKLLREITSKIIYAVDKNFENLETSVDGIVKCRTLEQVPQNSIDAVVLMDVLEHVEDEESFLSSVLRILKPGGEIIITLPAHQFLFSNHDRFMRHFRRYNIKYIQSILHRNNLDVFKCHYFYTTLFFIRGLEKLLEKAGLLNNKKQGIGKWPLRCDSIITRLITKLLNLDFKINAYLYKFKIIITGLSICVICKKRSY